MQPPRAETWVGKTLSLSLDGRPATGRVEQVDAEGLVLSVSVNEPAPGRRVSVELPDGTRAGEGAEARVAALELTLPWPGSLVPARPAAGAHPDEEADDVPAEQKRQHYRLAIKLAVDLIEETSSGRYQVARTGVTHNLSGGGMLVEFNPALLPGEHAFRLHLGEESLIVRGRAIRRGAAKQAILPIEFVGLRELDRSKVIRFIFNKMRNVKELTASQKALQEAAKDDVPSYKRRLERFYAPPRVRYHP